MSDSSPERREGVDAGRFVACLTCGLLIEAHGERVNHEPPSICSHLRMIELRSVYSPSVARDLAEALDDLDRYSSVDLAYGGSPCEAKVRAALVRFRETQGDLNE